MRILNRKLGPSLGRMVSWWNISDSLEYYSKSYSQVSASCCEADSQVCRCSRAQQNPWDCNDIGEHEGWVEQCRKMQGQGRAAQIVRERYGQNDWHVEDWIVNCTVNLIWMKHKQIDLTGAVITWKVWSHFRGQNATSLEMCVVNLNLMWEQCFTWTTNCKSNV